MGKKRNKHRKIVLLARSKLDSIQSIISKTLTDASISQFKLACNETENYWRLKENIKMKIRESGNIERDSLMEHVKRIGTDEIIKQEERT